MHCNSLIVLQFDYLDIKMSLGINTINTREQCPLEEMICMIRMVEQANQCTINR